MNVRELVLANPRDYIEVEGIKYSTYAGKAASACRFKFRGIMGEDLLIPKLLDFITLMTLNNKFANLGIFITDQNREECYIKIIELGDESLILDLEKYINIKDSLLIIENLKNEYKEIISSLQNLVDKDDEEKVNDIVEEYLRR